MTGDVVITGTNGNGETIRETFALDETDTIAGTKAFAAVTKVEAPAQTTAGDTVLIGWGAVYGLPYRLAHDTVLCAFVDNTKEATPSTVTCDTEHIEGNTIALNTAPNGKQTDLYLIV